MVCKHCGYELKATNVGLWGAFVGPKCWQSQNGKHVLADGNSMVCKHCGYELKATNVGLWGTGVGPKCRQSPDGKHEID
jgi:predicted Zn-ribbon and HTH transcriptional regulator